MGFRQLGAQGPVIIENFPDALGYPNSFTQQLEVGTQMGKQKILVFCVVPTKLDRKEEKCYHYLK